MQTTPIAQNWSLAGRMIERYRAPFCVLLFALFWLLRSQVYSGDGDQITRMTEAGAWMMHTELLSQFLFRLVFVLLSPFGWDGFAAINLVSCIAGAIAVWVLLLYNAEVTKIDPVWTLALFFSSGFALFCTGHTEYYTMFLIGLFWYGYAGVRFLQGKTTMFHVGVAFGVTAWLHLGILFATPSLALLLLLKGITKKHCLDLARALPVLVGTYLMKSYHSFFGLAVWGLSPENNFIPVFFDPERSHFYTLFSLPHILEWIYGFTMRSWIFLPFIALGVRLEGIQSLLKPERMFLALYTLCFTAFTFVWHPNLGITQDWDLFAIEAAPALLLLLTYMPALLQTGFRRAVVTIPVTASVLIMLFFILNEARFNQRDYGTVSITVREEESANVTYNGHKKPPENAVIREGFYSVKVIEASTREKADFFIHVAPDTKLDIPNLEYTATDATAQLIERYN